MEILTEMAGELRTKNPVCKNNQLIKDKDHGSVFLHTGSNCPKTKKSLIS